MSQMQRLVGVGRRKLDHHGASCVRELPEIRSLHHLRKHGIPILVGKTEVEKSLDTVECADFRDIGHYPFPHCSTCGLGSLTGGLHKREDYNSVVSLKFLSGNLDLNR